MKLSFWAVRSLPVEKRVKRWALFFHFMQGSPLKTSFRIKQVRLNQLQKTKEATNKGVEHVCAAPFQGKHIAFRLLRLFCFARARPARAGRLPKMEHEAGGDCLW